MSIALVSAPRVEARITGGYLLSARIGPGMACSPAPYLASAIPAKAEKRGDIARRLARNVSSSTGLTNDHRNPRSRSQAILFLTPPRQCDQEDVLSQGSWRKPFRRLVPAQPGMPRSIKMISGETCCAPALESVSTVQVSLPSRFKHQGQPCASNLRCRRPARFPPRGRHCSTLRRLSRRLGDGKIVVT